MVELAEMLANVIPFLDKAKDFLEKEAGFQRYDLALANVSESEDGERWIITFFYYNLPSQETYCEVEVSKKDGEMLAFRRLESDEEAQHEKTDKSTVARKLIAVGIEQTQKARAHEEYRRGGCTIWKASEKAGIPLREMIELLRREKIPLQISTEDVDEAWREAVEG